MRHDKFFDSMNLQILKSKIQSKEIRVALVGFGYIGTCIGAVIAKRGFRVFGIDVRKNVVEAISRGEVLINEPGLSPMIKETVSKNLLSASTSFAAIKDCDVVVVTVGTPLGNNFDPDTKDIVSATESILPYLRDGHLVVLKSTVPPNVTEKVVKPILDKAGKKYFLAFCPERLAEGRAIAELETIPVVVGGVDQESSELAACFWEKTLALPTIVVDNAKTAELVKLADNLWIDLNVALANELAILGDKLGIDALQVIAAANTLPKGTANHYVNILAPSIGVGGYCLTKDPWFVHHLGQQLGVDLKTPVASRTANDRMPEYSFSMMKELIEESGRKLPQTKVAILGLAFKNNTGDCRYTPTKPIVELFEKSGCQLVICDPWVRDEEAKEITRQKLLTDPIQAIQGAGAVIFLTGHDEFRHLGVSRIIESVESKAVIVDGRNFFDRKSIEQLREAGLIYKGIGR
jgi:dTDP-alpha-D-glucose dehydrogenase